MLREGNECVNQDVRIIYVIQDDYVFGCFYFVENVIFFLEIFCLVVVFVWFLLILGEWYVVDYNFLFFFFG